MMIHTITVDNSYYGDDEEYGPRTFEIDMPDRIYLQVVDEEDGTPANDDWWTHSEQRINESDVPYVPLAHLEKAEAERAALWAERNAAVVRAEAAEAERDAAIARIESAEARIFVLEDELEGEQEVVIVLLRTVEKIANRIGIVCYTPTQAKHVAKKVIDHLSKLEAERDALRAEVATLRSAAHMPEDYEYGLASWINQQLYASYIGAGFSEMVMEQIRNGRLTFPEAPIYVERDALRAERNAAVVRAERAEAEVKWLWGALNRLQEWSDAEGWRPVSEWPSADQDCEIILNAQFICSHYHRDDDDPDTKYWIGENMHVFEHDHIRGWRPLPAPPTEDGTE